MSVGRVVPDRFKKLGFLLKIKADDEHGVISENTYEYLYHFVRSLLPEEKQAHLDEHSGRISGDSSDRFEVAIKVLRAYLITLDDDEYRRFVTPSMGCENYYDGLNQHFKGALPVTNLLIFLEWFKHAPKVQPAGSDHAFGHFIAQRASVGHSRDRNELLRGFQVQLIQRAKLAGHSYVPDIYAQGTERRLSQSARLPSESAGAAAAAQPLSISARSASRSSQGSGVFRRQRSGEGGGSTRSSSSSGSRIGRVLRRISS